MCFIANIARYSNFLFLQKKAQSNIHSSVAHEVRSPINYATEQESQQSAPHHPPTQSTYSPSIPLEMLRAPLNLQVEHSHSRLHNTSHQGFHPPPHINGIQLGVNQVLKILVYRYNNPSNNIRWYSPIVRANFEPFHTTTKRYDVD